LPTIGERFNYAPADAAREFVTMVTTGSVRAAEVFR
jgi:hypothetical protein